ncbi:MAG: hypothetical protein K0U29_08295 [Gammaproteobacteria bacterium]|nr:hypothetical protein [Gammaproteobacteria bacterium]
MLKIFRSLFSNKSRRNFIRYRVIRFDVDTRVVTVGVVGKSVVWKDDLANIIAETSIVFGLSCRDASWLGFYYGRDLRANLTQIGTAQTGKLVQLDVQVGSESDRYRVLHQGRNGLIKYLHVKSGQTYEELPLSIIRDDKTLSGFSAPAACYLGILSGYQYQKKLIRSGGDDTNVVQFSGGSFV